MVDRPFVSINELLSPLFKCSSLALNTVKEAGVASTRWPTDSGCVLQHVRTLNVEVLVAFVEFIAGMILQV